MNTSISASNTRYSSLFGLLALGAIVAQGCGSDSNPAPTPPTVTGGTSAGGAGGKGGSGAKGGSGGTGNESGVGADGGTGGSKGGSGGTGAKGGSGGKGGSGAKGGSGGTGNSGNTGNESGTGNEGGSGDVTSTGGTTNGAGGAPENCDPVGTYQCYPCPPTTNEQYLNRCNDSKCSKFDNATRIQNYNGTLPPL